MLLFSSELLVNFCEHRRVGNWPCLLGELGRVGPKIQQQGNRVPLFSEFRWFWGGFRELRERGSLIWPGGPESPSIRERSSLIFLIPMVWGP